MRTGTITKTLLLGVLLASVSCTEEGQPQITDHSFEFVAHTEHDMKGQRTQIRMELARGSQGQDFTVSCSLDGQDGYVLKTETGEEHLSGQPYPGLERAVFTVMDRDLPKGDHLLIMDISTERWRQELEIPFTVDYQPFSMKHTISTAAEHSSELTLELVSGDPEAEYTIICSIPGEYGYVQERKITFRESDRKTISLPLVRPGDYVLSVKVSDGRTGQSFSEQITEIIRERYRNFRLAVSEDPQGEYSLKVPENPYRIAVRFRSVLTMKGSCDYDDVQSDRDGDWPWPRTAYSEESDTSRLYQGVRSLELLHLHYPSAVDGAVRDHTEQHCHFSECEGDWGYPSSCLTGYSYIHHTPYEEILDMDLKVSDIPEGVKVTFRHDLVPYQPKGSVVLNGNLTNRNDVIEIAGTADGKE